VAAELGSLKRKDCAMPRGNNNHTARKTERNAKGSERQEIDDEQLLEVMHADCHRGFNVEGCGQVAKAPRYE
jgi:hypothetical protein